MNRYSSAKAKGTAYYVMLSRSEAVSYSTKTVKEDSESGNRSRISYFETHWLEDVLAAV